MADKELRDLDAEIHLRVMDAGRSCWCGQQPGGYDPDTGRCTRCGWTVPPRYSSDIAAAWRVVCRVQQVNPGWRFSLVGGDRPFPTLIYPDRMETGAERQPFGWSAEFFGHEDPKQCTGRRHGTAHEDTPELAICKAALAALRNGEG